MSAGERVPVVVCFGGGGAFGYGFNMGVAEGMMAEGLDLSRAPMLGTSAGSHTAVSLSAGLSFEHVAPLWQAFVEGAGRKFWVRASDLSEEVYGAHEAPGAASVVVRLLTWRRRVLRAGEHRPADIVAASSSPFPLARPHKVDGKRYIDGGHRSVASADLCEPADLLILLAPFSESSQGMVGKMGKRQAVKETKRWKSKGGGEVLQVGPDTALLALPMKGMKALGDMRLGRQAHALGVPLGREVAERIRREFPAAATALTDTGVVPGASASA